MTGAKVLGRRLVQVALVAVGLVGVAALSHGAPVHAQTGGQLQFSVPFQASGISGVNAGASINGSLNVMVQTNVANLGAFSGVITTVDGLNLNTTGQLTGSSMTLTIDLGNGNLMFGTGSTQKPALAFSSAAIPGATCTPITLPGNTGMACVQNPGTGGGTWIDIMGTIGDWLIGGD